MILESKRQEHYPQSCRVPHAALNTSPAGLDIDDVYNVDDTGKVDCDAAGIQGLEEQLTRLEEGENRRERKRDRMEATRKAICEALVLWGSKADLLQVHPWHIFCVAKHHRAVGTKGIDPAGVRGLHVTVV